MSVGVYIPDNRALDGVLAEAPRLGFRPDHAAYFLHSVCAKRHMADVDKNGFARLDSRVLKRWIQPRALRKVKEYLAKASVFVTAGYSTGHFSIGYRIAPAFDGPPRRYVIEYPPMASKLLAFRERYKLAGDGPETRSVIERRTALLNQQRDALAQLSLPAGPAELARLTPKADAGHVQFVAQCIENHDHDGLIVDAFGWRVHHIITRTSSHLRPRLLLGGRHVAEVDVANSQPLLLAILLACASQNGNAPHIKRVLHIMEGARAGAGLPDGFSPNRSESETESPSSLSNELRRNCGADSAGLLRLGLSLPSCGAVVDSELRCFRELCESGELYDVLADDCGITRDRAKKELFRDVLFGKHYVCGKITRAFGVRWPSLLGWVRAVKKEHGHKIIARALQRLESIIMLDGVGNRLLAELPGVPFLTIHDSAMLVADEAQAVQRIMVDEFARWGVKATIRVKAAKEN